MSSALSREFIAEVERISLRYATEFVERFNFCPFASAARTRNEVARRVFADVSASAAEAAIAELAAAEHIVIGLLIFPRATLDYAAFDDFVVGLREHATAHGFATATFHPSTRYSMQTPSQLALFFRRTPDPTIQLIRFSALDAVRDKVPAGKFLYDPRHMSLDDAKARAASESVSDQIARHNHETICAHGIAAAEAVLADIKADRDRTYASFSD